MKIPRKSLVWAAVALALAVLLFQALKPRPVPVDLAMVARGPLVVTIDEDGETRIKERYMVSAPLAGRLQRIGLKAGDEVKAEETLLVTIEPRDPALLDPRERSELEARVGSSLATVERARAEWKRAEADAGLARSELDRLQAASQGGATSPSDLDQANARVLVTSQALRSAEYAVRVAEFEYQQAQAAFTGTTPRPETGPPREDPAPPPPETQPFPAPPSTPAPEPDSSWSFPIKSPINGRVLRVLQESATVVQPGDRLLELGDPSDLEIWIDVLTTDAVKVRRGDEVLLEHWGGDTALHAVVRLVEPAGFTKVSALGVEEKRAWIIADFTEPHERWSNLGDNYRVEARIVIWKQADVLKIPAGALFRHGDGWAAFRVNSGRAELRPLVTGQANGLEAEVVEGLAAGDSVIVHPGDQIRDGITVKER